MVLELSLSLVYFQCSFNYRISLRVNNNYQGCKFRGEMSLKKAKQRNNYIYIYIVKKSQSVGQDAGRAVL